jgi:hypothetical protein
VQGEGYFCSGTACKKQCSVAGHRCLDIGKVKPFGKDDICQQPFAAARASHLCIPEDDTASSAQDLSQSVDSVIRKFSSVTEFSSSPSCKNAIANLACFTVARQCDPATDVELPLCSDACAAYQIECGLTPQQADCDSGDGRVTQKGHRCAGAAGFRSISQGKRRLVLVLSALFSVLLLLFVLLWGVCFCATGDWLWCMHRNRWRAAEIDAVEVERGADGGEGLMEDDSLDGGRLEATEMHGSEHDGSAHRGAAWIRFLRNPMRRRLRTPAPLLPLSSAASVLLGHLLVCACRLACSRPQELCSAVNGLIVLPPPCPWRVSMPPSRRESNLNPQVHRHALGHSPTPPLLQGRHRIGASSMADGTGALSVLVAGSSMNNVELSPPPRALLPQLCVGAHTQHHMHSVFADDDGGGQSAPFTLQWLQAGDEALLRSRSGGTQPTTQPTDSHRGRFEASGDAAGVESTTSSQDTVLSGHHISSQGMDPSMGSPYVSCGPSRRKSLQEGMRQLLSIENGTPTSAEDKGLVELAASALGGPQGMCAPLLEHNLGVHFGCCGPLCVLHCVPLWPLYCSAQACASCVSAQIHESTRDTHLRPSVVLAPATAHSKRDRRLTRPIWE